MKDIFPPTQIGYFQFKNLILNEVPFLLMSLAEKDSLLEMAPILQSYDLTQLNFIASPQEALSLAHRLANDKNFPILLLCQDGSASLKSAHLLSENSYKNVYTVRNGVLGLTDGFN